MIEHLKSRIKVVKKEMSKEKSPSKKARLNRYKQKLELQLASEIRKSRTL